MEPHLHLPELSACGQSVGRDVIGQNRRVQAECDESSERVAANLVMHDAFRAWRLIHGLPLFVAAQLPTHLQAEVGEDPVQLEPAHEGVDADQLVAGAVVLQPDGRRKQRAQTFGVVVGAAAEVERDVGRVAVGPCAVLRLADYGPVIPRIGLGGSVHLFHLLRFWRYSPDYRTCEL